MVAKGVLCVFISAYIILRNVCCCFVCVCVCKFLVGLHKDEISLNRFFFECLVSRPVSVPCYYSGSTVIEYSCRWSCLLTGGTFVFRSELYCHRLNLLPDSLNLFSDHLNLFSYGPNLFSGRLQFFLTGWAYFLTGWAYFLTGWTYSLTGWIYNTSSS